MQPHYNRVDADRRFPLCRGCRDRTFGTPPVQRRALAGPPQHGHSYALRVWPHSHQQSPSLAAHGLRTMISSVPRSFRHLELILGFALRVMPEQALRLLTTWRADETSDFQWKLVPGAGLEPTRPLRDPGF